MHGLRAEGIGPGAVVAVYLDRGPDVVAAMLAIMGVGAAYTVVEPDGGSAEAAGRLEASAPDLVLTTERYLSGATRRGLRSRSISGAGSGGQNADDEEPPAQFAHLDPDGVAYVLYTSGSTGVPKGVLVSHANIRHYTEALIARLGVSEPLSYAHVTTLAADLGNTCLFLALWTGGTLHLVDNETRRDPQGLLRYLGTEQIDIVKTTPSHWEVVFRAFTHDPGAWPRLKFLILGGETLSFSLARRVVASGLAKELVNHYGPTETTVGVAAHVIPDESVLDAAAEAASVPIGTPLGQTRLLIRTADGTMVDRAGVGELYVAGPSVALGYRGESEDRDGPFTDGAAVGLPGVGRLYRTGDRVRADADGVLEFLGRGDRQVKIDGFRVELGHVEAQMRRLDTVGDVRVFHVAGDRAMLVAAVIQDGAQADAHPAELRRRLRDRLPAYMIPERVVVFDTFPRTAQGKTDASALAGLLEDHLTPASRAREAVDEVVAEVVAVWEKHLGHGDFDLHDEFPVVGGTSITAIQVIADLQAKGHAVTAAGFLAEPTVAALSAHLKGAPNIRPAHRDDSREGGRRQPSDDKALSAAQAWFFQQDFAQPDHWNQALLLDIAVVEPDALAAAVADVLAMHPLLRTAFRRDAASVRREVMPPGQAFAVTKLGENEAAPETLIRQAAAARQAEISVAQGVLFKAHLFQGKAKSHLLLICHHLSVDALSWHTLVNDLSRCYSLRHHGGPAAAHGEDDFGTWVTHVRNQPLADAVDLSHWDGLPDIRTAGRVEPAPAGDNLERDAHAVWFALSREQTSALADNAAVPPHAMLLGAFSAALTRRSGHDEIVVDIESHGRVPFHDTVDVSRTVGWFTSTFPVRFGIDGSAEGTGKAAAAALDAVPRLGLAYGIRELPRRSDICFNYLGSFVLPFGDELRASFSRLPVGPVRGPANDRVYGLKITARHRDGQLVVDLSSTPARHSVDDLKALAMATCKNLLPVGAPLDEDQFKVEHGSSTGLLAQVYAELALETPPAAQDRDYPTVLLTGATGFIGSYLLQLLLTRTSGRILCLVRPRDDMSAADRLREAYGCYLPARDLDRYKDRVEILSGDLSEPGFGLDDEQLSMLRHEVDAIYHLAGDTRLFGDRTAFRRQNTDPVRELIRLAETGRPKDLHHVSTLAVCGTGPETEPVVFSEDSLDVGQHFLNGYEDSKYDAERLVRAFAARGGGAYVYRCGNVTGHSESGLFQRNGKDNRLVQLLRGAIRVGRVPDVGRVPLALTPVDLVAEAIFTVSRSGRVRGGTFHVETRHEVTWDDVFNALRANGFDLADDSAADFATLFGRYLGDGDEQISIAHFWASRADRNVRFDHSRSLRLLDGLGVTFPHLDSSWLKTFVAGLVRQREVAHPPHHRNPQGEEHE